MESSSTVYGQAETRHMGARQLELRAGVESVLVTRLVASVRAAAWTQEAGPAAWRKLALRCALAAYRRCLAYGLGAPADEALHELLPELGTRGRLLVLLLRSEYSWGADTDDGDRSGLSAE